MHSGYMVCQICESYHDSVEELNAHYESDHPTGRGVHANEEGRFPCEFCDKTFSENASVYKHQRRVHGRESAGKREKKADYQGNFPCAVCGKKLSSLQGLKYHMKAKHNAQN